jgi:RNA polymerase sigma factor (sigma-70 family)
MARDRTVYLVDDDKAIRHALRLFLESMNFTVREFGSAEAFLEGISEPGHSVLVLDLRMKGMSGLELQAQLRARGIAIPIIFISGHGDVQLSVIAMKSGAVDFLEKPFENSTILGSLRDAFAREESRIRELQQIAEIERCCDNLTSREREVMKHIVEGMSNRMLAEHLGLSNRTVEVHRSRVMKKMRAESLPDLVRKVSLCKSCTR